MKKKTMRFLLAIVASAAATSDWNEEKVSEWAGTIGPAGVWKKYGQTLAEKGIDGPSLNALTLEDLSQMDVMPVHARIMLEKRDQMLDTQTDERRALGNSKVNGVTAKSKCLANTVMRN